MKKGFLVLGFLSLMAQAIQIDLSDGDVIEVTPNRTTTVTCSAEGGNGGGNSISCVEECQKWYTLNEWRENQWQNVSHCAHRVQCEVNNTCIKKIECERFETTQTWIHNQWQNVIKCVGTKSTLSCT